MPLKLSKLRIRNCLIILLFLIIHHVGYHAKNSYQVNKRMIYGNSRSLLGFILLDRYHSIQSFFEVYNPNNITFCACNRYPRQNWNEVVNQVYEIEYESVTREARLAKKSFIEGNKWNSY